MTPKASVFSRTQVHSSSYFPGPITTLFRNEAEDSLDCFIPPIKESDELETQHRPVPVAEPNGTDSENQMAILAQLHRASAGVLLARLEFASVQDPVLEYSAQGCCVVEMFQRAGFVFVVHFTRMRRHEISLLALVGNVGKPSALAPKRI